VPPGGQRSTDRLTADDRCIPAADVRLARPRAPGIPRPLRLLATHHAGLHRLFQRATWLWAGIFLLLTACLAAMMMTEPAGLFLMLSTVVTIALVAAGTGGSALWFLRALPRLGLSLRFAPAADRAAACAPPGPPDVLLGNGRAA
jgi:hypothetical protein